MAEVSTFDTNFSVAMMYLIMTITPFVSVVVVLKNASELLESGTTSGMSFTLFPAALIGIVNGTFVHAFLDNFISLPYLLLPLCTAAIYAAFVLTLTKVLVKWKDPAIQFESIFSLNLKAQRVFIV